MPFLAAGSVFLAIVLLMRYLTSRQTAEREPLERRLRRAKGEQDAPPIAIEGGVALRSSRFSRSNELSRILASIGSLRWIGKQLERSGWRMSVIEFMAMTGIVAMVAGLLCANMTPIPAPAGALIGFLLPLFFLTRAVKKRRALFVKQLVDALAMIANALKAGVGLMQAIDQVADQLKAPISEEFRRTLRDIRIGSTPDDAFTALADRVGSDDLEIVITAIIIQRSTGGNLAEILENVGHTMRERIRIRGEIKTLTSQQQLSGYLIAMMPIGLLGMFQLINPVYMQPLFTSTLGHIALAGGGFLQLVGFLMIRKIVNIEV